MSGRPATAPIQTHSSAKFRRFWLKYNSNETHSILIVFEMLYDEVYELYIYIKYIEVRRNIVFVIINLKKMNKKFCDYVCGV